MAGGDFTAQFARYAGDGNHHGTFEFYPAIRTLLQEALASATAFDTGWVGVKKAIMSFRLRCTPADGRWRARCEVSLSDDLDTSGHGERSRTWTGLSPDQALEELRAGLEAALAAAETDQMANEAYVGFCVGHATPDGPRRDWCYTLLLPKDPDTAGAEPPGDVYDHWGWEDLVPLPADDDACAGFFRDGLADVAPEDIIGPQAAPAADDPFTAEGRGACLAWAVAYVRGAAVGTRYQAGPFCIEPCT
jgi:hypothetical protein